MLDQISHMMRPRRLIFAHVNHPSDKISQVLVQTKLHRFTAADSVHMSLAFQIYTGQTSDLYLSRMFDSDKNISHVRPTLSYTGNILQIAVIHT